MLFFGTVSFSQQELYTSQQHFGVEEGLPQGYISGILQDKDGFIWLATLDGICRYDGRSFRSFGYRRNDTTGFSTSIIQSFGPVINNTVTLFYEGYREDDFDLATFKITRKNVRGNLQPIPGAIWQNYDWQSSTPNWPFIMSQYTGVGWLNGTDGSIHFANKANGLLQQDTVKLMVESSDGRFYVVSERGVEVSDTAKKKFEFIRFETQVGKLPFNQVINMYYSEHSIVCLPDNRLAVCSGDKFIILDLNKRSSVVYTVPPASKPEMGTITRMLQVDTQGRPYFAYHGRVFRLSEQGALKLLWENTIDPSLRISAVFIDRSDVLWTSINAQGLYKVDLQALPFRSYSYKTSFVSDIITRAGASSSLFPAGWAAQEASYYFRYAYNSKGKLYLTDNYFRFNTGDVFRFDQKDLQLLPGSEKDRGYTALLVMPNDEIWVFDQWRSCWICLMKPGTNKPEILQLKEDLSSIEIADARYMGGYIWLSTYSNGLLQYDREKKVNQFFGNQPNGFMPKSLTEICPDPLDKNRFWIGSRGEGLILWDAVKGLQQVFTVEDGLPNNTIYCILPDRSGKIWCSTNKGIFRFDPVTKQVTAFEKTDGLSGNEFNRAHKFLFPDGRMAFGGLDGYTIFDPADFDIKNKRGEVPVSLTGLQINSQQQDVNIANSIIHEPLPELTVIDLPYNKNYLRFEFAAMLFNQPQKTKYRYQLVGADGNWVENGTNNIASYAALRPGRYTLKLNATDNNGLWSDTVKEISIHIHPPFWRTWWAYLIYALIGLILLRTYFIFRERRIKAEQSLAFEKREALRLKEVDELKDRFFSNITHEFRTPLTLIISPLEKLVKDPSLSPAVINSVRTAQRNSQQLLRLINEFLDFSKLNDGQLGLKLSTGELDTFTADCVRSFETAATEKNIHLSFSAAGIAGLYLFDHDKWEKIIINLVGNALKFTPQNGKVEVRLYAADETTTRLEVKDNGPGIPAGEQQKVFDRFYQVDDSSIRVSGGTGIGLSLVKELAELMKGTVELDSKPGQHTRFIIEVPLEKVLARESSGLDDKMQVVQQAGTNNGDELPLLLIAEDNEELRAFLVESMRKYYRVIETNNGIDASELILQELPDIIISDVMMPGQDGFDLCRICKTDKRTAHIGFILLTAKAAHDARLKGLGTGADDYITKPFHLEELELRTANLLQLQQKQRAYLQAQLINVAPQQELPVITDPFLQQLYQEMDAKLDDPELGVDYLCKTMAMSRSTLNRKLKSLLDISTNQLIRQYRLQKAASLLLAGMDITSVAYKVGFSSPSYFSQNFKEHYGMTPSEYISNRES